MLPKSRPAGKIGACTYGQSESPACDDDAGIGACVSAAWMHLSIQDLAKLVPIRLQYT